MHLIKLLPVLFLALSFIISQETQGQKEVYTNPIVQKAKYFRVTEPLRDMEMIVPGQRDRSWKDQVIRNEENIKSSRHDGSDPGFDPSAQHKMGENENRTVFQNFDGVNNINGVYPPDTDGDVGPNHYFQMVNLSFAIYSKTGTLLYGPADNSTLWNGFIGPWTGTNDGDPIVLYDEQADRWLASQFAVNTSNGTYWELIAISTTNDPTGSYYQYAFQFPDFNDYPKFGVWPDGYYASFNIFGSYNRVAAAVFERDSMLIGNPNAQMILFDLPTGSDPFSMLPADFDGTPPPAGTPCYFAYFNDDAWGYANDQLRIWEFDTDWNTPSNSTFGESQTLQTSAFDSEICTAFRGRCIPQPATTKKLESISDRLMFRLQYRNFGSYQVMVTNHTVDAGSGIAGIRWYELRNTGSGWNIHQQSTYSPDTRHRWMGSMAMDGQGNIALGYSVSNSTTFPSIRFTGRLSGDALNQMTIAEATIIAGSGSQTGDACRWGDYSMMSVDPSNPTIFWYTQEYIQTTGTASWRTRIASFEIQPPMPTANAGNDTVSCEQFPVFVHGSATNYSSVLWTTTGDGSFSMATMLNAIYTPGSGDIAAGGVDLVLSAFAVPPLTDTVSDTMHVTIYVNPTINAGNDTTICENQNLVTQPIVTNASSILWHSNGDGHFNDSTLINATYYPGTNDKTMGFVMLDVTAYPLAPCMMTSFDMISLSLHHLPTAEAGNNDTICEGGTTLLQGQATNFSTLLWTTSGDGTFSNNAILNPVYTPGSADISNGGATLTLTAFPTGPCTANDQDNTQLVINALPGVNAGSDQSIPFGTFTTLTGTATGGSGDFTVLWTPEEQVVNPQNLITETVNLETSVVFTLTVTDNITGCENSDDVTITVTGGELSAEASATPPDVCLGNTTQLDVLASGGSGVYTYLWSSDPPGFSSTQQNPVVAPQEDITYIVAVDDGFNSTESSVDVTVQEPVVVSAGPDTTICHDEYVLLHGSVQYQSSILWTTSGDGEFTSPTFINSIYMPGDGDIANGSVVLTLTAQPISPCTQPQADDLTVTIEYCPGTIELKGENTEISIIPNPNTGSFDLSVKGLQCNEISVNIVDLLGQSYYASTIPVNKGSVKEKLNLESLKKGIYFIRIQCGNELFSERLIIQ